MNFSTFQQFLEIGGETKKARCNKQRTFLNYIKDIALEIQSTQIFPIFSIYKPKSTVNTEKNTTRTTKAFEYFFFINFAP